MLHLPKLVGGEPVTMPGKDGVMTAKIVVIARCKRRARLPRPGDAEGITPVCEDCLSDALASLAAADQTAEHIVHAILEAAADGLLDLAASASPPVATTPENPT